MFRFLPKIFSIIMILALTLAAFSPQRAQALSQDIVISQVYGGGGNSGGVYTNDFIELFNRGGSTVSLAGWSLQYTSATGTGNFGSATNLITPLSGSLAPGQYLLVQEAAGANIIAPLPSADVTDSTPINMSGTGGKVALVNATTPLGCNGSSTPCPPAALATIVDLVGWDGANFFEGSPAPATANATAVLRGNAGCVESDNNSADFSVGAPAPRNSASPFHYCSGPTDPTGAGKAAPNTLFVGDPTLLSVAVSLGANPPSSGLAVSCDLSTIGGSSAQAFFDDGTNGDATAGDLTFSFATSVAAGTSGGAKSLACTVSDAQLRSSSASIALTVTAVLPIGVVNGPVPASNTCETHASPYVGQTVTIKGVIYEKTLQAISNSSNTYKGFYIQNTAATADGDPTTSDGLFVFMSTFSTMIGGYAPQVGDEVIVSGKISEYFNFTELGSASMLKLVRSGVDIDAEVTPAVANPPIGLADANCYWERLQGMRVQAPLNSIVLGGRNVFSPADAEIWLAAPDSAVALRDNPFARKAYRDAHPLDDNYDPANWDGNGYRILLGSLGIKAAANDAQALIDPARSYSTLTNAPAGGLNYTFSKYRIEISAQPTFNEGVDPAQNNPPAAVDLALGYSIVDYNLENLYDYRDNPSSGCDFAGNTGCPKTGPFLSAVNPPYDYVPASDAAYQARLNDIALQIVNDLHNPDVLMVQEVENQDICRVTSGAMDCGAADNRDGKPDVLQELALKIAANGGASYDAAFDRDSSDLRGIAPAFLYRTDRAQLLPAAGDPVLGAAPALAGYTAVPYDSDVSNPKTLNAVYSGLGACETSWVFPRAPGVALFRIWRDGIGASVFSDVYLINNHFKSGPNTCVAHRTEQANFNAALVAYIQAANPNARIVVGGDLNVYPRPDDPFAPIGQPGASDQLGALYDPSLGLENLWDVLLAQAPESAYSYIYLGMAQTLDQMFINQALKNDLQEFRIAHINSDFPADYPGDAARGTSDHDPNAAAFTNLPSLDKLRALVKFYADNGMISGNNTVKILLNHLDNAAAFLAAGQHSAYQAQLQAFSNQVQGKAPKFVTQAAADALSKEAAFLLSLP